MSIPNAVRAALSALSRVTGRHHVIATPKDAVTAVRTVTRELLTERHRQLTRAVLQEAAPGSPDGTGFRAVSARKDAAELVRRICSIRTDAWVAKHIGDVLVQSHALRLSLPQALWDVARRKVALLPTVTLVDLTCAVGGTQAALTREALRTAAARALRWEQCSRVLSAPIPLLDVPRSFEQAACRLLEEQLVQRDGRRAQRGVPQAPPALLKGARMCHRPAIREAAAAHAPLLAEADLIALFRNGPRTSPDAAPQLRGGAAPAPPPSPSVAPPPPPPLLPAPSAHHSACVMSELVRRAGRSPAKAMAYLLLQPEGAYYTQVHFDMLAVVVSRSLPDGRHGASRGRKQGRAGGPYRPSQKGVVSLLGTMRRFGISNTPLVEALLQLGFDSYPEVPGCQELLLQSCIHAVYAGGAEFVRKTIEGGRHRYHRAIFGEIASGSMESQLHTCCLFVELWGALRITPTFDMSAHPLPAWPQEGQQASRIVRFYVSLAELYEAGKGISDLRTRKYLCPILGVSRKFTSAVDGAAAARCARAIPEGQLPLVVAACSRIVPPNVSPHGWQGLAALQHTVHDWVLGWAGPDGGRAEPPQCLAPPAADAVQLLQASLRLGWRSTGKLVKGVVCREEVLDSLALPSLCLVPGCVAEEGHRGQATAGGAAAGHGMLLHGVAQRINQAVVRHHPAPLGGAEVKALQQAAVSFAALNHRCPELYATISAELLRQTTLCPNLCADTLWAFAVQRETGCREAMDIVGTYATQFAPTLSLRSLVRLSWSAQLLLRNPDDIILAVTHEVGESERAEERQRSFLTASRYTMLLQSVAQTGVDMQFVSQLLANPEAWQRLRGWDQRGTAGALFMATYLAKAAMSEVHYHVAKSHLTPDSKVVKMMHNGDACAIICAMVSQRFSRKALLHRVAETLLAAMTTRQAAVQLRAPLCVKVMKACTQAEGINAIVFFNTAGRAVADNGSVWELSGSEACAMLHCYARKQLRSPRLHAQLCVKLRSAQLDARQVADTLWSCVTLRLVDTPQARQLWHFVPAMVEGQQVQAEDRERIQWALQHRPQADQTRAVSGLFDALSPQGQGSTAGP